MSTSLAKYTIGLLILTTIVITFPKNSYALIFIPAVILIPIAYLVAIIIGALAVPISFIGMLIGKAKKMPRSKIAALIIAILVCIAIVSTIIISLLSPDRPII